ncbi:MAG: ispD, partial [Gammaproteobacteria bacterium]|nr:ispD [Gammaproteobacteria bacterium]
MSKFSNRYWVVIPAAGIGKRMGGEIPKQYLDLHGKPILMRTLGIFLTNDLVTELVVAIAPGDQYWPSIAKQIKDQRVITIEGGGERCQSVLNGLYALSEKAADNDWVLVHDAVRPCLSQEALHRLFAHLSDHPTGGLLGCPLSDTLKRTDDQGSVLETLDRSHVWQAQTPQMFRYGLLKAALERAITNNQM